MEAGGGAFHGRRVVDGGQGGSGASFDHSGMSRLSQAIVSRRRTNCADGGGEVLMGVRVQVWSTFSRPDAARENADGSRSQARVNQQAIPTRARRGTDVRAIVDSSFC